MQLLYILRNSSPAHSLPVPVLCELLAVIDSFDELHGCRELHPPVRLLSGQAVGIETADVLHSGQQARGVCLGVDKREILTACLQSSTSTNTARYRTETRFPLCSDPHPTEYVTYLQGRDCSHSGGIRFDERTLFQQGKMTSRPRERRGTLAQSVKVIRTSRHVKPVVLASYTSDHLPFMSKKTSNTTHVSPGVDLGPERTA